jgi:ABC-type uncharacterized transport system YnjBCD permease subunit
MSNVLAFALSIAAFALILGAGGLGLWAHGKLPEEQKNDSARAVVGQVLGVVSLLLSVALGVLVGQSYAYFQTQRTELETVSAQVVMLDVALAQFGPRPSLSGTGSRGWYSRPTTFGGAAAAIASEKPRWPHMSPA